MGELDLQTKKRAWELAHKLITLGRAVAEREGRELLVATTDEICRAMGKPGGASIEEVKRFVCQVLELMQGYQMYMACGCGFLSIRVTTQEACDRALEENRDLRSYTPEDLDGYFDGYLLSAAAHPSSSVPCSCPVEA